MSAFFDVCMTDFGPVRMRKSAEYLDSIAPSWRQLRDSRPRKNEARKKKHVRKLVADVETTILTLAAIKWAGGEVLESL